MAGAFGFTCADLSAYKAELRVSRLKKPRIYLELVIWCLFLEELIVTVVEDNIMLVKARQSSALMASLLSC